MKTRFLIPAREDVAATAFKLEHMRSGWGDIFDQEIVEPLPRSNQTRALQPRTEDPNRNRAVGFND